MLKIFSIFIEFVLLIGEAFVDCCSKVTDTSGLDLWPDKTPAYPTNKTTTPPR